MLEGSVWTGDDVGSGPVWTGDDTISGPVWTGDNTSPDPVWTGDGDDTSPVNLNTFSAATKRVLLSILIFVVIMTVVIVPIILIVNHQNSGIAESTSTASADDDTGDAVAADYYTKSEVNTLLDNHKSEVNTLLDNHYTESEVLTLFGDYYTKTELVKRAKASGTFDFTGGVGTLVNSYNATAELKSTIVGDVDLTKTFHMGDWTFYQIDVTFDSQLHDANYQVFVTESHTYSAPIMLTQSTSSKSEFGFSINVFNHGTDYADADWGMDFVVF